MKQTMIFITVFIIMLAGCSAQPGFEVLPSNSQPQISERTDDTQSSPDNIVDPDQTYSYDQMVSDAAKLKEKYSDIIDTETIGKSVEGR